MSSIKDNNSKTNYIRLANLLLKYENVYVDVIWTNKKGSHVPPTYASHLMLDEKADYTVYEDAGKKKKIFTFNFDPDKKSTITLNNGESLQLSTVKGAVFARKLLKIREADLERVEDDFKREIASNMRLAFESVKEALRM